MLATLALIALGAADCAALDGGVHERFAHAEAKLRALEFPAAQRALESALEAFPGHLPSRELLGAMLVERDPKRSKALLKGVPPPAPLPVLPGSAVPDAGFAWAIANPGPRMMDQPTFATKARTPLTFGTPVEVEQVGNGGWVRVRRVKDRAMSSLAKRKAGLLELSAPLLVPAVLQQEFRSGWVKVEHLTGVKPTADAWEELIDAAVSEGRFDEAFVWAQRQQWLAPSRRRLAKVISFALSARRWRDAGAATVRPSNVAWPGARGHAALDLAWGCVVPGEPRVLFISDPAQGMVPAVCVDPRDVAPCPSCGKVDPKAHEAALEAFAARRARLRREHPNGPMLKVRVDPFEVPAGAGVFLAVSDRQKLLEVLEVPLPKVPDARFVADVWAPVPVEEHYRYELFYASSLADAQARVAKGTHEPVVELVRPGADCRCDC